MTSALIWKEYREHRMVWVALAVLGASIVLSRSILLAAGIPQSYVAPREMVLACAAMLVGAYALICGAMMLAGESENGTLAYLDGLPGLRLRIWRGKLVAGFFLVLAQIVFVWTLAAALSLFEDWREAALTGAAMLALGLYGLPWGMLFSSFGRSVMSMILLSMGGHVLWTIALALLAALIGLLASIFLDSQPATNYSAMCLIGLFILTPLLALVGSALVFSRPDRERQRVIPASAAISWRSMSTDWTKLFWLTWRQGRSFALGIAAFALFLGFVLLIPAAALLWPAATLLVGVLCGATAFADEQQGPFHFIGDQRLSLGKLWLVKVGFRFAIAGVAALLVLAPSFLVAMNHILAYGPNYSGQPGVRLFAQIFHTSILAQLCPPGLFLTLWLIYGFSAGCLFGLLFRHGLAAGVFAMFTASLTATLWLPSLLCGGLHAWQVFGPPVLLLIGARMIMRPWAVGRIASWETTYRLAPFVILSGLWIAGGLWYRVLEIPDVPMVTDLDAFRASLPSPVPGGAGQIFHSACFRFENARGSIVPPLAIQQAAPLAPGQPAIGPPARAAGQPPGIHTPPSRVELQMIDRAGDALEKGWPPGDRDLSAWLDKLFVGDWVSMMEKAASLPTSPFDVVKSLRGYEFLHAAELTPGVAVALAARGLQRQAAGDEEGYVENLRIGLALSRSLRDHTPIGDVMFGRQVEGLLIKGLNRWLERFTGPPELLHKALDVLSHHLDETAQEGGDQALIGKLIIKNTADDPLPMLVMYLANYTARERPGDHVDEDAQWVATAWLVPWERERNARILRIVLAGDAEQLNYLSQQPGGFGPLPLLAPHGAAPPEDLARTDRLCAARAAQLKLALRWFEADKGKPVDNLDELVPKYLPSIPLDPYDNKPFRYRLWPGEDIEWPPDADTPPAPAAPAGPPDMAPAMGLPGPAPAMGLPGPAPAMGLPGPAPATYIRKIPPGQGVLWSVGRDGVDDGGRRQSSSLMGDTGPGEDFIFLVPLPLKAK